MANTYVDYTGDGQKQSFDYTFAVLSGRQQDHIIVGVDDSTTTGGKFEVVDPADYTIDASAGTITFDTAPELGARIRIRRDSDASTLLVDFQNGTVLPERDLDLAYLHNLFLNEEIEEGSGKNTLVKNADGNYDGDSVKLVNLADPEDPQDAVTKGYADGRYVDEAGDTMTGNLDMGSNEVTSSAVPSGNNSLTNKSYVDGEVAAEASNRASGDAALTNSKVNKSGDTMTGALTLPAADPSSENHATRKRYVDQQIAVAVSSGTPGGPIETDNIDDGAITTAKIDDGAVTTAKIDDDAVTAAKLDHTTVTPGSYTNTDITVDENGRITAASNGSSGAGATNLGQTLTNTSVEITSSTGDNTTIAGAVASGDAGVMTGADKNKLDNLAAVASSGAYSDLSGTPTIPSSSDDLTEGTTNLFNQAHTGDVTGSTALTIANDAVTAAKISSTDSTFSIDGSGNMGLGAVADANYKVKVDGGTLGNTLFLKNNVSNGTNAILLHSEATNAKGAILQLGAPNNTSSATSTVDINVDALNNYIQLAHNGGDTCGFRCSNSTGGSNSGSFFPVHNGTQDLGKSTSKWGTLYASAVNINGNTSFVSKYASGWFNNTTGLTNGGTYSFTHGLGTAEAQVQIWMATSSAGANIKLVPFDTDATDLRGASITALSTTSVTVQLTDGGWTHLNSDGSRTTGNWGTTYTHIKVVVIG